MGWVLYTHANSRFGRRVAASSHPTCFFSPQAAAEGDLDGILGYEDRPLVSVDFKDDPRSSIVDAPSTMVIDDTQVKILSWYDNECGYANRMMDLVRKVARTMP